jgi:hypothetical protein
MPVAEHQFVIDNAAQHAYEAVALEKGVDVDEVHRMRVCHRISELMVGQLVEVIPDAHQVTRGGWTVDSHSYVGLSPDSGPDDIIADATWQQFIDAGNQHPDAPKVLIGQRADVIAALREHGVDDRTISDIWEVREKTQI